MKRHADHIRLSQVTGPNGSLFDAIPISTPPGFAPLPTGSFALPLGIPQESNPGCLPQANQYSAWSCKMTFAPLVITINDTSESEDCLQVASMKQGPSVPDKVILYGLQTPLLDFKPLGLVQDLDYRAYGPAFHFNTFYDKLVVLRPEELSLGSGFLKRQDDKGFRQRFQVKPGDMPWYCFWNHTYIEGYIYAQDNSSAASFTALPSQTPSSSPGPISTDTAAIGAATIAAAASSVSQTSSMVAPATPTAAVRRDSASDPAAPARMAPYPRIVKIEERRLPDSPQPYCQQMLLLDNGDITFPPNGKDSPDRIWLQEQDPSYEDYRAAQPSQTASVGSKYKREAALEMMKRSDPPDACHCQWMFK